MITQLIPALLTIIFLIIWLMRIINKYGAIRENIIKDKESIDNFLLTTTDENNRIDDFIKDAFEKNTLLSEIVKQWITLQGQLSNFQFLDFERHVENSTVELELDTGEYSKSFLLSGLLVTFLSFGYLFSSYDQNNFQYFVSTQLFGGIATAFGSTIAAILCAGFVTFYGKKHNDHLVSFRSKSIEILITKVHPMYSSNSQDHALQQMQQRWSTLANLAEESSRTQRGMIEAMKTNMTALNEVINSFVQTSRQNKEIVEQIEQKIIAISNQNESIELGTENLLNSVDAIKSVFQAENNSLTSIKMAIENLGKLAQNQQSDYNNKLDTINANQSQFSQNIISLSEKTNDSSSQVNKFLGLQENLNKEMMQTFSSIQNDIRSNETFVNTQLEQSNEIKNQVINSNKEMLKYIQQIPSTIEKIHHQSENIQTETQKKFSESLDNIENNFNQNMNKSSKELDKLSKKFNQKIKKDQLNNFWTSFTKLFSKK